MPVRAREPPEARGPRAELFSPELVLAGRAWLHGRLQPVEIGIGEDGRILRMARSVAGARRRDLGERVIVPSATDLHVHFRDPGGPEPADSFPSGTLQAALGGVGLVGEMPNTVPPVTRVGRLEDKTQRARGRISVDVVLYAAATTPTAVGRLARKAGAFKLYLSPTTGIEGTEDEASLPELLEAVARSELPLAVHAEDPRRFSDESQARNPVDWNSARPPEAETSALDRLLPGPPGLRLHIAHVTLAKSVERLREAGASFEATAHHLLLRCRSSQDSRFKVNPPLRAEAERAALWAEFVAGKVPILASDHAPHFSGAKDQPFALAPSGMPGVETTLPLLLAHVRSGDLPLPVLLGAACDRPARWFGVPQGRLALGHRANLLAVDFRARTQISARRLHSPTEWSAFEGWEAIFPSQHYLDGRLLVDDGEFVGGTAGRVLRPEFAPNPPERSGFLGNRGGPATR